MTLLDRCIRIFVCACTYMHDCLCMCLCSRVCACVHIHPQTVSHYDRYMELAGVLRVFGRVEQAADYYQRAATLLVDSPLLCIEAINQACACQVRVWLSRS